MIKHTPVNFQLKVSLVFMLAFSSFLPAAGQVIDNFVQVKSPFDEQHPVISPSGDLFFTIAFHPENLHGEGDSGDVWLSTGTDTTDFQVPSIVIDLSTSGYDVVVGFLDANSILVYHSGGEKIQGIHQYSGSRNSWEHEKQLNLGSFRNNSEHFSGRLAPSGDVLILSMESYFSYGNEDIYVSFLRENGWTDPQNLGPQINSYQQEVTPSLTLDNRVLFFSSNGPGSKGGRDIFYAERLDETWGNWSIPTPLSSGNSTGVELSYFQLPEEPTKAIFTTTQNSDGYGDIMMVHAEKVISVENRAAQKQADRSINFPTLSLKDQEKSVTASFAPLNGKEVIVMENPVPPKESEKEESVDPEIFLEDKEEAVSFIPKVEPFGQNIQLMVLDRESLKEINFEVALSDYSGEESKKMDNSSFHNSFPIDLDSIRNIKITAAGYLPLSLRVDQLKKLSEPILMTPASVGLSMVLEQVLFKRGTAEILDENSMEYISSLAEFLKDNPTIKILLEGHTDNHGNAQLNKELSLERASAIRRYLVDEGVEFERVRIAGWGGIKPISSNESEEGRRLNRRVEMVISDR